MMNQNRPPRKKCFCSFCDKMQSQVQRLIAGPGGIYICNECVAAIIKDEYKARQGFALRCSFCGKLREVISPMATAPKGIAICGECIELCQEIFKEDQEILRTGSKADLL